MALFKMRLTFNRLPEIGPKTRRLLRQVVDKVAFDVEAGAKTRIQGGPKTGRQYRRKGGIIHQASAPGESPATDTGNLASDIFTTSGIGPTIRSEVNVGAEYGAALEFGGIRFCSPVRPSISTVPRRTCWKPGPRP
jgi:hypothetical protein